MSFRQTRAKGVTENHVDYKSGLVEREFARALEIRRERGLMWMLQIGRSSWPLSLTNQSVYCVQRPSDLACRAAWGGVTMIIGRSVRTPFRISELTKEPYEELIGLKVATNRGSE